MITGLLGKKRGMTQIFTEEGDAIPVTVIEVGPCPVMDVKAGRGKGGRTAVQIAFDPKVRKKDGKPRRVTQPIKGLYKKVSEATGREIVPHRHLKEFLAADEGKLPEVGHVFNVTLFAVGEKVKVSGTGKGKGFAGVMKRHGFAGGRASHGSMFHRAPGSVGCRTWPGRVTKGKSMPGHMGSKRITTRGLEIVRVDEERNLIYLRGAVPGANNGLIELSKLS